MLKLWVDCVCPQLTVAKVENCWLYDSYPPVRPPIISHMQHAFRQANFCLPFYSFVHQIEGLSFRMSHRCLGTCLKTGFQTLAPRAYPPYYSTTVLYFVMDKVWIFSRPLDLHSVHLPVPNLLLMIVSFCQSYGEPHLSTLQGNPATPRCVISK